MKLKQLGGALSVGAAAVYPYSDELAAWCKKKDKYGEEYEIHRVVGYGDNKRIWMPRNYALQSTKDMRVDGSPANFTSKFEPRHEEQAVLPGVAAKLLLEGKSFRMEAPCGWGKTYATMHIIALVGKKTIVVVTREDIMEQWATAAEVVLGLKPHQIGHIQADKYNVVGKNLVIAMIQSMSIENRYPASLFQEYGLAVFDESGAPDTLVTTSLGQLRIQDLVRNKTECVVLSFNTKTTKYEWKPILAYHEHPPKNPLIRVTHEHGSLDFTSEHLFYTDRGWLKCCQLVVGDVLFIDAVHSKQYNNSKQSGVKNGSVDFGHSVRGREHEPIQGRNESQIAVQPFKQAVRVGVGEAPKTERYCANPTKSSSERWLGGGKYALRHCDAVAPSSVLPFDLHTGRSKNTSAITCIASVEGVVSMVVDGRWFMRSRLPSVIPESLPPIGRRITPILTFKLWATELCTGASRFLSRLFQGVQPNLKARISPPHNLGDDVQAERGSFRWEGSSVQGLPVKHTNEGRGAAQARVLPEGNMPESKKVYELPHEVHSAIGGGKTESDKVGRKARVLSVARIESPDLVYDIEVEGNRNFVANGIVVHNCHRVGSEMFSQACYAIPARRRLGLSATPHRKDGRDEVIQGHIGPVMVCGSMMPMIPKVIAVASPWEIPYVRKVTSDGPTMVQLPHTAGKCTHILKMLSKHQGRNGLIVKFVFDAYSKGRKVLIQSEFLEHLDMLDMMLQRVGIPVSKMGHYARGLTKGQREVIKTKQIIRASYQMTKEATDIPDLDTLIMATPKSDVGQIVGRILRFVPDKKEPLILDIVDHTSSVLNSYWGSRKKWYASKGVQVVLK